jgi:16S rRNA (adenine(1408)-N(1))-methyltransferase
VVADVGTGEGKSVLRRARRDPGTFFVGIDAAAEPLADASRAAARKPHRGGAANALFLVAAAEALPGPLAGRVDEACVILPWGSLLRGFCTGDPGVVGPVAGLLRDGGRLEVMLSVTEAEASGGLPPTREKRLVALLPAYAALGLECLELREAGAADVERLSSSWARRLGIPSRRTAWLLVLRRNHAAAGGVWRP